MPTRNEIGIRIMFLTTISFLQTIILHDDFSCCFIDVCLRFVCILVCIFFIFDNFYAAYKSFPKWSWRTDFNLNLCQMLSSLCKHQQRNYTVYKQRLSSSSRLYKKITWIMSSSALFQHANTEHAGRFVK